MDTVWACLHCGTDTGSPAVHWCSSACHMSWWAANRPDRNLPPIPPLPPGASVEPSWEGRYYRQPKGAA